MNLKMQNISKVIIMIVELIRLLKFYKLAFTIVIISKLNYNCKCWFNYTVILCLWHFHVITNKTISNIIGINIIVSRWLENR